MAANLLFAGVRHKRAVSAMDDPLPARAAVSIFTSVTGMFVASGTIIMSIEVERAAVNSRAKEVHHERENR